MSEDKEKREEVDIKLDDIVGAEVKVTGADIPEGSYPATLFAFGQPFKVPVSDEFKKKDGPTHRIVFELRFGLFDKSGTIQELQYMVPVPEAGEVNRKSNLYKAMKSLAAGDTKYIDDQGNFTKGTKLTSFVGRNVVLGVKKNKKEWPQIESVAPKMDGAKYPSLEECKKLLTSSEDIPF